jgi:hypothetical protein
MSPKEIYKDRWFDAEILLNLNQASRLEYILLQDRVTGQILRKVS